MLKIAEDILSNFKDELTFDCISELFVADNPKIDALFDKFYDGNNIKNSADETLLFKASEKGSLGCLKTIIKFNKNYIDKKNNLGNTALWIACSKRFPCIIQELLNNGADVNS